MPEAAVALAVTVAVAEAVVVAAAMAEHTGTMAEVRVEADSIAIAGSTIAVAEDSTIAVAEDSIEAASTTVVDSINTTIEAEASIAATDTAVRNKVTTRSLWLAATLALHLWTQVAAKAPIARERRDHTDHLFLQ